HTLTLSCLDDLQILLLIHLLIPLPYRHLCMILSIFPSSSRLLGLKSLSISKYPPEWIFMISSLYSSAASPTPISSNRRVSPCRFCTSFGISQSATVAIRA